MKRSAFASFAVLALFATASATAGERALDVKGAKKAAEVITEENLRDYLTFIAADALLGRDTPSPGLDAAANFLAFNLKKFGAKPGGDNGTFFQRIKLVKPSYDKVASVIKSGDTTLGFEQDFTIAAGNGKVSGSVIYVPESVENTDVKGKVVLLGAETGFSQDAAALKAGALAVIRDSGQSADVLRARVAQRRARGGGFRPETTAASPDGVIPVRATTTTEAFKKLADGVDLSSKTPVTSTKTISITAAGAPEISYSQNVVAIVEGSDPKLKEEFVAFGAHYDHIGVSARGTGDLINNGADDDGSGTVSILNIAQAALSAKQRPKRSLLFVWHCGEEKGLWGSDYYTANMTVPKGSIVTQLNIDMIGRSKPEGNTNPLNKTLTGADSIYVIGTTMMSTRLGEIVHSVNKDYLKIGYDAKYDDPKDPNRFFYRSDHFNYAKNGIPICFWFDGEHEDYHRVGDEVSKIDFKKMERIARTVFVTGVTVANEAERPKVDKPLDR